MQNASIQYYDTLILGGGAAAYAAAMYAARYEMKTALIEEEFGGETALAGPIENYPGFEKVDGFDLMQRMKEQAKKLGVTMIDEKVTQADNAGHCFRIHTKESLYEAKTIIFATGTEKRLLNLPKENELRQRGVHYCATCDGPLYKGKRVAVVGGGDSAVKYANQIADVAEEVFLIVRDADVSRAEPINRERLLERKNVHILYTTEITALHGEQKLESITLSKAYKKTKELSLDAVFVAIGSIPQTDLAVALGVTLDEKGYISVDPRTMQTNIDGVFAAGDVSNASGAFKQIITGAAQGAIAATSAYQDLGVHGGQACLLHALPVKRGISIPIKIE